MTTSSNLPNQVEPKPVIPPAPADGGTGTVGRAVFKVLFFLSGLAIGGQTAIMMLREGSAQVPLILVQAAIATLVTIGAFMLVLRLVSRAQVDCDPWLLQMIERETRPSVLVDLNGHLLFANPAYADLCKRLTGDKVLPPAYLFPTHAEFASAIYRLSEAVRAGQVQSETLQIPTDPAGNGYQGRISLSVQPMRGSDSQPVVGVWQLIEQDEQQPSGHPEVPSTASVAVSTHSAATNVSTPKAPASFDSLQLATEVLDHAPVGYLSLDAQGRILNINATLAHWLDWDLALFFAGERGVQDLFVSDCAPVLASLGGDTGAGHSRGQSHAAGPVRPVLRFEGLLKRADGGRMPVELIHQVEFDAQGLPLPSCGIVVPLGQPSRDIARVESTLSDAGLDEPQRGPRVSEHSIVMFKSAPIGVAILDQEGRISSSNQKFNQIFSQVDLTDSASGQTVLGLLPADQQGPLAYALHQATHQDGPLAPLNIALDGERSVRLQLARAYGGRDESVYVFATETTEQRNLEAQFAQAQKMQAVGELAGGIAHDFNNVLQGILGFTDLLLVSHRPTDPSFHDLMQIKSNATRAAGLVRQLLAFSRRQTLRPRVVSLNDAVTDVSHLLRRLLGQTVPLDIKLGRDLWPVMADPGQFEQAVLNLAVNARDAMPDGGRLTIRTRNVTAADCLAMSQTGMSETELPPADYVVFEIEDSGIGIAPQVISKIFQPFFTTKEVGKGTGLGLSMVYGFVKQSGGYVFCRSDVGQGTCFTILLPRLDEKDMAPPEGDPATTPAKTTADLTGAGTILLVEDEDGVRAFAARALSQRGYTVLEAASGAEALDVYASHPDLDLIVSDVVMPEMDGPTMLRELRKQGATVKVIFVSGYAEEAFAKNLPEGEDFGFLPKPFSLKQLIEAVKGTLGNRA